MTFVSFPMFQDNMVTPNELAVLYAIICCENMQIPTKDKEIANYANIALSTAQMAIKSLKTKNLITINRDSIDGITFHIHKDANTKIDITN